MKTSVRTKILAVFITGCMLAASGLAFAGPEEAAQYYEQASKAYGDGEYAKAADLLERAYAEDPNLIYQYNRILALQAMGKIDQALKVLDIYGNPMKEDGRFDDIKEIRAQLNKAKAKAAADKKAAGDTAGDDEKNAGEKDTGKKVADKKAGDDQIEDPDGVTEPVDSEPNILGWSLVGVGVAGLGTAGLFGSGILIPEVIDRRDCLSPDGTPLSACYSDFDDPTGQYQSDKDSLSTHQTVTWVSLGVGAVALIGGGALLLMDGPQGVESDAPLSADNTDVRLTPYVGADGAGGVLRVTF
jgi:hypothetical protein